MAVELADYLKQACAENGGTEDIYVYQIEDRSTFVLAAGVVTSISMKAGKFAVQWTPDMESGLFTDNTNRSREANSVFTGQTGMVIFKDDKDVTVNIVEQVAKGFLGIIVKKASPDGTTEFRHYGLVNGMTLEVADGTTGQLYEDLRGHTLNFVGKELSKAPSVPLAVVESIQVES